MAEFNSDDLNLNEPLSDEELESIPFDDSDEEQTEISHAPLELGGEGNSGEPAAAKPASSEPAKPVAKKKGIVSSEDRITGVKTFFTKLHAGAIDFLSEQVTEWLTNNPDVIVKKTNVVVGEIAAKKTEQNLIITLWY
jgi:hypothetical protein